MQPNFRKRRNSRVDMKKKELLLQEPNETNFINSEEVKGVMSYLVIVDNFNNRCYQLGKGNGHRCWRGGIVRARLITIKSIKDIIL